MRHPHHDLIVAWAADTSRVVQYKLLNDDKWLTWITGPVCPDFDPAYEWRFKPDPKPDVVRYTEAHQHGCAGQFWDFKTAGDNLKLTFDGETGKLKSAEVIDD